MKIFTSLNLDLLARNMSEKIIENWKSPLLSPIVIFSNSKVEQWFKLRWIKSNETQNSILMNLKTVRLEDFLFELVSTKSDDSNSSQKLSPELLRDILIQKLLEKSSKNDDKFYFETLNSSEVSDYIFDYEDDTKKKAKINSTRLYDFATEMASLFMEYEETRPENLDEILSKSDWQKKLYYDVFENSLIFSQKKYQTLFQVAEENKKKNGGKIKFNKKNNSPVFLFGFSGMGRLYRNLLAEFSKIDGQEMFLYIQTCANLSENKKSILHKWAELSSENLSLWKEKSQAIVENLSEKDLKVDSSIKNLQQNILNGENFAKFQSETDGTLSLWAAPSKLREVEVVHTKICQLLQKDETRFGDILVLAPNIQDYEVAIKQVFDQSNRNDKEFPYIPYLISDISSDHSLVTEALKVLFGILQKKYISRSDLFSLLRNALVQSVRSFSNEEVSDWSDWTDEMNVFRDRDGENQDGKKERIDDWEKAKNRLLLSRLSKNLIIPAETENQFLPYSNLTSENDTSLYKFISAIDELKKWLEDFGSTTEFSTGKIDEIREFLEKWIVLPEWASDNLKSENFVIKSVLSEIENQKMILREELTSKSEIFFFSVLDSAQKNGIHRSNILSSAVTFADFKPNGILSAKYVFFMGADSKSLPGIDTESVLDLRFSDGSEKILGDDSVQKKNKNGFLCQLFSCQDGFFISFVNKNLQKDEDFYQSSLVSEIFECEKKISMDENRPWSELFSKREFRNKKNFNELGKQKEDTPSPSIGQKNIEDYPDSVSISQIKKFLTEPFIFYAENRFLKYDDDSENELIEFEPLYFNPLDKSNLRKKYIQKTILAENANQDFNKEEFVQDLKNENILPDSFFGETAIANLQNEGELLKKQIIEVFAKNAVSISNIEFTENLTGLIREQKIHISDQNNSERKKEWQIKGSLAWHNSDFEKSKKLVTIEINSQKNPLSGYVSALSLISQIADEEGEIQVSLNVFSISKDKIESTNIPDFSLTALEAKDLLRKIYSAMFDEEFRKCVPFSELDSEKPKIKEFSDLKEKLLAGQNGIDEWNYFSKKNLFDIEKDTGYSEEDFLPPPTAPEESGEWEKSKSHIRELIKFLDLQNSDSQNEATEENEEDKK